MKNKITLEVDSQQTLVILKNSEGHTFEFNPNTKFGEELFDFLILSEKYDNPLLLEQNKKKIISTLKDMKKVASRYEKERQGLFQWELPLLDDVDKIVKMLEKYD
jgi:hypothetical protein